MSLSNKAYDILVYIQKIALPALITCLVTVLTLLKVDSETVAVITGIIAAFDTLMAALLQISSSNYYSTTNFDDNALGGDPEEVK